ncbi:hypothetical protein Acr_10g0004200 [Actinidia rufa]|uniref:Uncharacterized protein n=1 Tax=Actinidia rufa TaxID=165716 RepID=A0A7J0F8M4_9ERIC|nr:hypothetical protein Acr_10g0004200 [Actinidia rufa]
MGRFRTLGQKKSALTVDPPAIVVPPIIQVPFIAPDPVLILSTRAGVKPSLLEALLKCKGREVMASLQRASSILEQMKEQPTEIKKSKKKISFLEKQARLDSQVVEKAKLELVAIVHKRDDSNSSISKAQGVVEAIQDGWMACLKEFGVTPEHLAWKEAPPQSNEILEKSPMVVGELNQETAEVEEDDATTLVDGPVAAEDGVAFEGIYYNLFPDL